MTKLATVDVEPRFYVVPDVSAGRLVGYLVYDEETKIAQFPVAADQSAKAAKRLADLYCEELN